jgi:ABC-type bacteriocin/lantibiotic exporter with double-glycine peptidase domain
MAAGMGFAGPGSRLIRHDATYLLHHPGSLLKLRRARRLIQADTSEGLLPKSLYRFVLTASSTHQAGLAALTTLVFLLSTIPLEVQRRIVNDALKKGGLETIAILAIAYVCAELLQGALKMGMNIYRGWVGENSVRYLRTKVLGLGAGESAAPCGSRDEGVDIAIVVAEADPVGEFVGVAISEPLLQCGILVSLLGYMTYLQPLMAAASLAAAAPQLLFVPPMQRMINRRAAARILTLRSIGSAVSHRMRLRPSDARQRTRIQNVFGLNMSIYRIKYLMNFLMNLSYHLGMASILALGGYYVATGRIEVGTVLAFASGLTKINDPWGDLVNWYRQLKVTQAKYALIQAAPTLKLEAG